mmetsp:Transcript_33197/g.60875  ORF Transcript_33197/g.60875 Transcript_33197/m.60875 type:complete len:258 (+) Transcript_33197:88-861(+)
MALHVDNKFRPHIGTPQQGAPDHDEDLLWYLEDWDRKGVRFTEVTHIASSNIVCAVPVRGPLKHHGLMFKCEGGGWDPWWVSVHMTGSPDIGWKTYESFQIPKSAVYHMTYPVTKQSPLFLRSYLAETKPWYFPGNDCRGWAMGGLEAVGAIHRPWGSMHGLVLTPRDRLEAQKQQKALAMGPGGQQLQLQNQYQPAPAPMSRGGVLATNSVASGIPPHNTGIAIEDLQEQAEVSESDSEPGLIQGWVDRLSGLLSR